MERFFSFESPEGRALVAAARREPIESVESLDLGLLFDASVAEGLNGLVARALSGLPLPRPAQIRFQFQQARQAERNRAMLAELHRICTAFEAANIRVLTLKGAVLAARLYGDYALRAFSDLDLVVGPDDARRGEELLRTLGYETPELTPVQERTHRRHNYETSFFHPGLEIAVDFHWRFANAQFPLRLGFDEAWERRAHVAVEGQVFPALGDADLVLYTACHSAKHLWSRLELLASIDALRALDVAWPEVDARARRAGASRQLGLSFRLAHSFLGTPLPTLPHALALSSETFESVHPIVLRNLLARGERRGDAAGRDLFLLLDTRNAAMRALFVSALVPNSADWKSPRAGGWLAWCTRPLRLAKKHLHPRLRSR